jgi:hypothetical protein
VRSQGAHHIPEPAVTTSALKLPLFPPPSPLCATAIDFQIASELFKKRRRLKKADSHALHAVTEHHNKLVPTVGGLLLFGGNPEREFPDAWIQCGRFGGTNKSVIADSIECHCVLTKIADEAFEFIRKHTLYGATITALKRNEITNIPLRAAREILVNAVAHADYSQQGAPVRVAIYDDRLEIVLANCAGLTALRRGESASPINAGCGVAEIALLRQRMQTRLDLRQCSKSDESVRSHCCAVLNTSGR